MQHNSWEKDRNLLSEAYTQINENEEAEQDHSPHDIITELEKYLQTVKLNKSFGFNTKMSLQIVDHIADLNEKLKSSLTIKPKETLAQEIERRREEGGWNEPYGGKRFPILRHKK